MLMVIASGLSDYCVFWIPTSLFVRKVGVSGFLAFWLLLRLAFWLLCVFDFWLSGFFAFLISGFLASLGFLISGFLGFCFFQNFVDSEFVNVFEKV